MSYNIDNVGIKLYESFKTSKYWNKDSKERGGKISGLICPSCEEKSMYVYKNTPYIATCNRSNNCGERIHSKKLFPEVFENFEKQYPPTKEDKNAPARQYLLSRRLKNSIKNLDFIYYPKTRKGCGGAVMFPICNGVLNGRLFNPNGKDKGHNVGAFRGEFWKHPAINYDQNVETFVTEGVIDALSLIEIGYQAIALISSIQSPENIDLSFFKTLTFAFDNDIAGKKALKKWIIAYPDSSAVLASFGDWNDLLKNGVNSKESFEKQRTDFVFNAQLALARNAEQYAKIFFDKNSYTPGLFNFDSVMYDSGYKEKTEGVEIWVKAVSDFTLKTLYKRLKPSDASGNPEYSYRVQVNPSFQKKRVQFNITGSEIATQNEIKKVLGIRGGVTWHGDYNALAKFQKKIRGSAAPLLLNYDTIGFHDGELIHSYFKIDKNGNCSLPNSDGVFSDCEPLIIDDAIKIDKNGFSLKSVQTMIYKSWGEKGLTALSWAIGSWFRSELLEEIGYYPFLSLHGDPQTGKSNLIRILQYCQAFKEEGQNSKKQDTTKFIARETSKRSNLFFALLEQSDIKSKFDFDTILNAFDSKSCIQGRAAKTNDNKTFKSPMLCGMAFVQNTEPFNTQQQKERVISVPFSVKDVSKTSEAFQDITSHNPAKFTRVLIEIQKNREEILKTVKKLHEAKRKQFIEILNDNRIAEVHAIVSVFNDLINQITGNNYQLDDYLIEIAKKKKFNKDSEYYLADNMLEYFYTIINSGSYCTWGAIVNSRDGEKMLAFNLAQLKLYDPHALNGVNVSELMSEFKKHGAYFGSKTTSLGSGKKKCHQFYISKLSFIEHGEAESKIKTPNLRVIKKYNIDDKAPCTECVNYYIDEKGNEMCKKHNEIYQLSWDSCEGSFFESAA